MTSIARPTDAREAQELKDALGAGAAFVGGGTALQLAWGDTTPELTLIDVNGIPEAQGVSRTAGGLRIGAAIRVETLRRDPLVRAAAPLLAHACDSLAALAVRHLATIGGNAGWRCGDTLAPLLVLDAQAEQGDGSVVALAAWLAAVDAPLLLALHLPVSSGSLGASFFEKVGHRAAFSPTRIAVAVHGGRVAITGAGLPARRLLQVEQLLDAQASPSREDSAAACSHELADASLARLAARLLHGHLTELA
jgi:CO/xanthine dehydrogenase FAD-binding subunit